jgi:hypothetical protein
LWFLPADTLEFNGLINPTWYPEGGHELHAEASALGTLASEVSGDAQWPVEMLVSFEPFADSEWIVVAMGAFDGSAAGEFRAYADRGATVISSTRSDAFLVTERDFEGAANVVARESLPPREAVVEAKAQAALSAPVTIERRLFASFWGGDHVGAQSISVDTPDGALEGREYYLLPATAPGDYAFRIDRNVDWHDNQPTCRAILGERCWRAPAFALGSDIAIPTGV